jgi:hypothetical protein
MKKPKIESKLVQDATKMLVDKGLLIEAGWVGYMLACKLQNAPPAQLAEMQRTFFAGSLHTFTSVMSFLEEGQEPTEADMKRMSQVFKELKAFQKNFEEYVARQN